MYTINENTTKANKVTVCTSWNAKKKAAIDKRAEAANRALSKANNYFSANLIIAAMRREIDLIKQTSQFYDAGEKTFTVTVNAKS